jgi:hypothetical protein
MLIKMLTTIATRKTTIAIPWLLFYPLFPAKLHRGQKKKLA